MTQVEVSNPFFDIILPYIAVFLGVGIIVYAIWLGWNLIKRRISIEEAKNLVMFKVLIPKHYNTEQEERQQKDDYKETISVAEQFISSFYSLYNATSFRSRIFGQRRISLEIIAKDGGIYFFVGVPKEIQSFAEKQIHSVYPDAQVEISDECMIFKDDLKHAVGGLKLARRFIYPIKTYKILESDPLNAVTNTLSKLGEGSRAGIQILIQPATSTWRYACSRAAKSVQEGKYVHENWFNKIVLAIFDGFNSGMKSGKEAQAMGSGGYIRLTPVQEELLKALREKGSKVGFRTQIRVVTLSPTEEEAKLNLENILNSFSQFNAPEWNHFGKIYIHNFHHFLADYILRAFTRPSSILNTEEIASIFHFPNRFIDTPNIHWLLSRTIAPPTNIPPEGIIIGKSVYRGEQKFIKVKNEDRRRHIFMIGKTGVGKTTFFENMIIQDILDGKGVCFIDPLGDAIEYILGRIPKERAEDVVLFDPSDVDRPMGLNLLEYKDPAEKDFLIAEWLEIFYKLFDPNRTGMVGPQFEHWGRNASLTVMAQPEGGTLIEIPRLFTDDAFRDKCVASVKDPVVEAFWKQQMAKTADFHKSEMFNYFISKFGRFMTNDIIRNIIGQKRSAFNLREIMDSGKILLINLSKGKIGEMNSYLLGMILVSKIQVAAFSRADTPEDDRKDFYLYVDEFQNFTTDTFKTILSEARKYHLSLNITNQYIAQLSEPIRDAVIGNAGSLVTYRIGAGDAEFMVKEFPGISVQDMVNLEKYNMYVKLLIDLTPSKPFSMLGMQPQVEYNKNLAEAIRQLSRLKYGRDKNIVDEEIRVSWESGSNNTEEELPPRREE